MTKPWAPPVETSTTAPLPDQVEICARSLDGHPCRGVIFRRGLDGTLPYCPKCGAEEPGVVFMKIDRGRDGLDPTLDELTDQLTTFLADEDITDGDGLLLKLADALHDAGYGSIEPAPTPEPVAVKDVYPQDDIPF